MKLSRLLPKHQKATRKQIAPIVETETLPAPTEPLNDRYYQSADPGLLAERRQLWRSRMLFAALLTLGFLCFFQAATILTMMPLKQSVPYLVTFHDSNDKLVALQPTVWSATTAALLQESAIRRYIRERTEIIPIQTEMNLRWFTADGTVPAHTAPDAYRVFQHNARELWNENIRKPFVRSTRIRSVVRAAPNLWRAEFTTTDDFQDPETIDPDPLHWSVNIQTASIRYTEPPTYAQFLRNPLGLIVTQWVQVPILPTSQ